MEILEHMKINEITPLTIEERITKLANMVKTTHPLRCEMTFENKVYMVVNSLCNWYGKPKDEDMYTTFAIYLPLIKAQFEN